MFGESTCIEGIPEHIAIDPSIVFDFDNAREFLMKQLGDGWCSVDHCRKTIKANYAQLIDLDESFWLESLFLEQAYDQMIRDHLRGCMLSLLPGSKDKRAIAKVVAAARCLATGPVVSAQKHDLQLEMTSAVDTMLEVSEANGPPLVRSAKCVSG